MDGDILQIKTGFLKKLVSNILSKIISKKFNNLINPTINILKAEIVSEEGKNITGEIAISFEMTQYDLKKILEKVI